MAKHDLLLSLGQCCSHKADAVGLQSFDGTVGNGKLEQLGLLQHLSGESLEKEHQYL